MKGFSKHKQIGPVRVSFYQMTERVALELILDWSMYPIIFEITILFWSFEIVFGKEKKWELDDFGNEDDR